jgi:hypothetical protein
VKRCLDGFLLAASVDQRVKYADRLYAYGKDHVEISVRLDTMIENLFVCPLSLPPLSGSLTCCQACFHLQEKIHGDAGWTRDASVPLFDAYEPTLMRDALTSHPGLCPLIFGDLWPALAQNSGIEWNGLLGNDPLSLYFAKCRGPQIFFSP